MFEKRSLPVWGFAAAGLVGGVVIMLAPLTVLGLPHRAPVFTIQPTRIVVTTSSAALAMAWTFYCAVLSFRRADEFWQHGSKVAWYWGATLGLAAAMPVYAFIMLGGLHWLFPADHPVGPALARAFQLGFALPVAFELVGFLIVTAWWRWWKGGGG